MDDVAEQGQRASETGAVSGARTLLRGLALLEAVGRGHRKLAELSAEVGTSRSTTHRLASALVQAGYLRQEEDGYRLSGKLIELGSQAESELDVPAVLHQAMIAIAARTGEAAHIGVLDGPHVVYVDKARSRRGIELASRIGSRFRAQNTALGKVLLAAGSDRDAALAFDPELMSTSRSLATQDAFLAAVRAARTRGYAVDHEESELGISCVAGPIVSRRGDVIAAMSVSAPSVHMTPDRVDELIGLVTRACRELTDQLGSEPGLAWR